MVLNSKCNTLVLREILGKWMGGLNRAYDKLQDTSSNKVLKDKPMCFQTQIDKIKS